MFAIGRALMEVRNGQSHIIFYPLVYFPQTKCDIRLDILSETRAADVYIIKEN